MSDTEEVVAAVDGYVKKHEKEQPGAKRG